MDIEITYSISGSNHVMELKLMESFYNHTTGQMSATFSLPEIPDGRTVKVSVSYIENRDALIQNGMDLILRKRPGGTTPASSQVQASLEDILRNILPAFTGSFSTDEFYDDELKALAKANNPLYKPNTIMGENPLYVRTDSSIDIWTEIFSIKSGLSLKPDNLFVYLFLDGKQIEISNNLTVTEGEGKLEVKIIDIDTNDGSMLKLVTGYIKIDDVKGELMERHGLSDEEFRGYLEALGLKLHLGTKPDSLSANNAFGKFTLNLESHRIRPLKVKREVGVIVANSLTNPELDGEIMVAILKEDGTVELKTFKIRDYGNKFIDEANAATYFLRHLDEDSDGDGLAELIFSYDEKPAIVTKETDKSTPLLMVTDGGLGDNVVLYLENGEVMFWSDGIDQDCDGNKDDVHRHTTTYIDTVTVDMDTNSLRIGRNPQTGKEIKIAAFTTVVITEGDGTVQTISTQQFLNDFSGEGKPDLVKVVADKDGNAILVHVMQGASVVYVDRTQLSAGGPIVVYTNEEDLTKGDIDYLISDEHEIELFIYRHAFGPITASSYRLWSDGQLAEIVDFTLEGTQAQTKKTAKFKAGKALAETVKRTTNPDTTCNEVIIGDAADMHSYYVKLEGIDGETKAVVVTDPFFDIFTEVSVEFVGHVTIIK